jgi:nucleotidyltransferase-like protein
LKLGGPDQDWPGRPGETLAPARLCYPLSVRSAKEVAQDNAMGITSSVSDDLLAQMAQVIVREVEPERIILFGSHARGEARPDSDVDLLVEREGFGKQRSRRREASLLWRALAHFPVPKDILVYSQAEAVAWKDSPGHIVGRALQEGRVLYERR